MARVSLSSQLTRLRTSTFVQCSSLVASRMHVHALVHDHEDEH